MDMSTGDARTLGPVGLAPVAWLNNGTILGTLAVATAKGATTTTVVTVDPVSGHLSTVVNRMVVVGVA
jgi:hypothetical protein